MNAGIIDAAKAGVVTSASLMVNLPAADDAIVRARSCRSISLGLHLNFTSGRPLTYAPSLTQPETGDFFPLRELLTRATLGLVDESDIERECLAQISRMTHAGFPPTHLDSHRHVHLHPAIYPTIVAAAASKGVTQIRIPREPLWLNAADWRASLKKVGLLVCTAISVRGTSVDRKRRFFGISLQGGRSFAERLFALITRLPRGTSELMTHPGYADPALAQWDSYGVERETELKVLRSAEFRDLLDRQGVTLASFGRQVTIVSGKRELTNCH